MDDVDHSRALATMVADAGSHRGPASTWSSIVDDAYVTVVALQGVTAVGRASAQDLGAPSGREALDRGIAALRDPVTSDDREARDGIEEALRQLGRSARGGASLDRILARLEGMGASSVEELSGGVQGSLLAMQVQQAVADGTLQVPDGEVVAVITHEDAAGLARGTGAEHGVMQVALEELVPRGFGAFRSVAEDGDSAGGALEALAEVGSDVVPVATLAMAGAELAWAWARGGDVGVAVDRLRGRAARATALNAVAQGVGMATGLEYAKVVIVVGGHVGAAAVERVDRELAGSIDHVRGCRRILDGLARDVADVP
jgi:hypothetical protein